MFHEPDSRVSRGVAHGFVEDDETDAGEDSGGLFDSLGDMEFVDRTDVAEGRREPESTSSDGRAMGGDAARSRFAACPTSPKRFPLLLPWAVSESRLE